MLRRLTSVHGADPDRVTRTEVQASGLSNRGNGTG